MNTLFTIDKSPTIGALLTLSANKVCPAGKDVYKLPRFDKAAGRCSNRESQA
jgi:hypothetical protein